MAISHANCAGLFAEGLFPYMECKRGGAVDVAGKQGSKVLATPFASPAPSWSSIFIPIFSFCPWLLFKYYSLEVRG